MIDLFGTEGRAPARSLRPVEAAVVLDLFSAAAEAKALRSGRPVSQERAELVSGRTQTAGAGFRCLRDHAMRHSARRGLFCPECDK